MKQSKTWIITDTHFNHKQMVAYCGRPDNHTEIILKNWRIACSPQDVTIHLGDVIIGRDSELKGMLDQVPGKKFLVLGNHDQKTKDWYMRNGFDFVGDGLAWDGVYFSHIPVETLPNGCTINIHGHFHNSNHRDNPTFVHSRLLAIENTDYKPVLLSTLTNETNEQKLQEMKKALEAQFKYDSSTAADIALDTLRRCFPEEYLTFSQQ